MAYGMDKKNNSKYEDYDIDDAARNLKRTQEIMGDKKLLGLAKKKLLKDAKEANKAAASIKGEENIKDAYDKYKGCSMAEAGGME